MQQCVILAANFNMCSLRLQLYILYRNCYTASV